MATSKTSATLAIHTGADIRQRGSGKYDQVTLVGSQILVYGARRLSSATSGSSFCVGMFQHSWVLTVGTPQGALPQSLGLPMGTIVCVGSFNRLVAADVREWRIEETTHREGTYVVNSTVATVGHSL